MSAEGRVVRAAQVLELGAQAARLVDPRLPLAGARPGLVGEPVDLAPHLVGERLLVARLPGERRVLLGQELAGSRP